jgi:hypothetical protein
MSLLKAFYWGQRGARENYALQIRNIVEAGYKSLGDVPIIIGECGVPIDMKFVSAFPVTAPDSPLSRTLARERPSKLKIGSGNSV